MSLEHYSRDCVVRVVRTATHQWKLNANEAVNVVFAFDEVWRLQRRIVTLAEGAVYRDPEAYDRCLEYFDGVFFWPEIHRRLGWGDLDRKEYKKWRRELKGIDLVFPGLL